MRPPNSVTCPRCGSHTTTIRVDHPAGTYFCTCGQLFYGTDREWHRLTTERRQLQERKAGHKLEPPADTEAPDQPTAPAAT